MWAFEKVLVDIIDRNFAEGTEILREATWILLIIFSKQEDWLQRVSDSGVLVRFEKLLSKGDAEITENVDLLDHLGLRKHHSQQLRTADFV